MRPCRHTTRLLASAVAVLVCMLVVSAAPGQEKPNPIVDRVKAAVNDPAKPFTLVVTLQLKEGTGGTFEAAFAKAAKLTRRENGCFAYDLSRDPQKAAQYLLYERWRDLPALEAHLRSEYITALLGQVGGMVAGPPEVRVLVPVGE